MSGDGYGTFRGVPMPRPANTIPGQAWLLGFSDVATVLRKIREKAVARLEDEDADRQYVLEEVLAALDVLTGEREAESES